MGQGEIKLCAKSVLWFSLRKALKPGFFVCVGCVRAECYESIAKVKICQMQFEFWVTNAS